MSKIQTIFSLLLFLFILFSMDMIFGSSIRETFSGKIGLPGGRNISLDEDVLKLNYSPAVKTNTKNGNMIYSGREFLAATPFHDN